MFGLPGALVGISETKIQTIVRVDTADREFFFLHTQKQADALRIELSVPLRAIRGARSARAGGSEHADARGPESAADQLSRLAAMLDAGLLTRDEFDHLKAKVIAES